MDWQQFYTRAAGDSPPDLQAFAPWQLQLAGHIKQLGPGSCLESGSGFGQTSYLLAESIDKVVAVDLEAYPLRMARRLFVTGQRTGAFLQGDLFHLPVRDQSFDVCFNAGVFEHFSFAERCRALTEMARVTRDRGSIIVAFPNHCSSPYRYSYGYRRKQGTWPYPQEHPLVDLGAELQALGRGWTQQRKTVDRQGAFHFLRRHQRWLFRLAGLFCSFEGYLTIITIDKQGAP